MLIDSHCHLDMIKDFPLEEVLNNAQTQGVSHFLCVSIDLDNFPVILGFAQASDNIFVSAGVHPNTPSTVECDVQTLVTLANHPKVVAIGETGLDYFRSQGDLAWQQNRFRQHIRAARTIQKPLIIHCRDAAQDTLQILRQEQAQEVGGVMHCFVEDWETAQQAMELGFYISFSGIVTFKNAQKLQKIAQQVPRERLLVETDAPYLAPVPHRGKVNQPAYVRHVAEFIATLREEPLETIARVTTENFFRLTQVTHQHDRKN